MGDQVDLIAIPAIGRAQHALAQPCGVLDDPIEHWLQIGRRVRNQAQHLGCRGLPLPGVGEFAGKPFWRRPWRSFWISQAGTRGQPW